MRLKLSLVTNSPVKLILLRLLLVTGFVVASSAIDHAHAQAPAASSAAGAASEFRVPALTGPVVDGAGILSSDVATTMETGLRKLAGGGGTQINVLTVPSLGGLEIEQASIKVTDAWKLGGAKTDNGILLLVAPSERRVRIEVGQGLEGALTDAFSNRIIRDEITPEFKRGDYSQGVLNGVVAIVQHTDPNVDVNSLFGEQRRVVTTTQRSQQVGGYGIFKLIFFLILMMVIFGGGRGGGRRSRFSPWAAGALGYGLGRGGGGFGGGGGWGGGSSGGGGGWGGGGGGFSGGGASGGW